jgi:hypothetical protein
MALKIGVIWGKYGLWWRKALSEEDNLMKGEWIVWGTWPEALKCNYATDWRLTAVSGKKDGLLNDWQEPYHLGRGTGRWSVSS